MASYNIGARQASSHSRNRNHRLFQNKLAVDIANLLRQRAEVINLQEINANWKEQVAGMLPDGWLFFL